MPEATRQVACRRPLYKRILGSTIALPGGVVYTVKGTDTATATWDLPTVRGDLGITIDSAGHQAGLPRTYGPFGKTPADAVPDNQPGRMDYGWLGQYQRPYEHAGALSIVEMGAPPYSPLLGRFLSVDPVEGGSANGFDYVKADPINSLDLAGTYSYHYLVGWSLNSPQKIFSRVKKFFRYLFPRVRRLHTPDHEDQLPPVRR